MINLILCGGSGTRLWPLSRNLYPKQFVKIFDEESLFQKTVKRNRKVFEKQFVISQESMFFLAVDQIEEMGLKREDFRFVLEPVGKNTAPAIAISCFLVDENEIVFVSPSDHFIGDEKEYEKAIKKAVELAEKGFMVTFGIKPSEPKTGFGYIEEENGRIKKFHEKPSMEVAKSYIEKGNFFWNSGMFCFKAKTYLEELKRYSPEIYHSSKEAVNSLRVEGNVFRIRREDMERIPENSIDYAVMEHTKVGAVVVADFGWNDVGSFDSLYEELPKDDNENAVVSKDFISINSKNNFLFSKDKLIGVIDVENMVVVDTPDALLVAKKGSSQKVKELIKVLKDKKSEIADIPTTVHRPWGTYTVLEKGLLYKIKKIVVKPGKRLSLQRHYHRNEHWIVVSGTAIITVGDEKKILRQNESTYIPMGAVHRLENPGKIDLVIIEAQVGEYIEEDDIERIEDDFGR